MERFKKLNDAGSFLSGQFRRDPQIKSFNVDLNYDDMVIDIDLTYVPVMPLISVPCNIKLFKKNTDNDS